MIQQTVFRVLMCSLVFLIAPITALRAQPAGPPGTALSRGMQLIYASQGKESPQPPVDSVDLRASFGTASNCSYLRMGQTDIRKTCVRGDTMFTWRDSTQKLVASRPLKSGMTFKSTTATGGTAIYETAETETVEISGMKIPVVKTTVTTLDASGKTVRRLRERFALSLGTATDGVFEAMQPDGTWKVTQEFSLVRIVKP